MCVCVCVCVCVCFIRRFLFFKGNDTSEAKMRT